MGRRPPASCNELKSHPIPFHLRNCKCEKRLGIPKALPDNQTDARQTLRTQPFRAQQSLRWYKTYRILNQRKPWQNWHRFAKRQTLRTVSFSAQPRLETAPRRPCKLKKFMLQQHGHARAKTNDYNYKAKHVNICTWDFSWNVNAFYLQAKKRDVKNEWESGHQNANYVADKTLQNENVKNKMLLLTLLAKQSATVRQTIGIAVRKRTRHHGQIQVRNAIFRIVLSLKKK